MTRVMVFGTFDGLHPGHLNLFKQARKYGDFLVAVVARDKTVKGLKKRLPQLNEKERLKKIKESGLVDKAMLGELENHYLPVKKIKPEVICLGYDQKFFVAGLRKELKKMNLSVKVYRLKPYLPKIYHTSKLRKS